METTLVSFIDLLRSHDIRVSPAETLDAVAVASTLGYGNRSQLRHGLSQALAKTIDEKQRFDRCFEQFFNHSPSHSDTPIVDNRTATENDSVASGSSPAQKQAALQQALADNPALKALAESTLWQNLSGDSDMLELTITQAASESNLGNIRLFTQKGQFTRRILEALGEQHLRDAVIELQKYNDPTANTLQGYRDLLRERVKAQVERAYLLHAEGKNQQFLDDMLANSRLNTIEIRYQQRVYHLVLKMARKLAARYARKRRTFKRGQLDMNKTLRRGIPNDGLMFETHWKKTRKKKPQILAVCDVSGSVSAYAKFLLMFLYSLQDVLPQVRSFAFSSHLGEVSTYFKQHPLEQAIERVNWRYGGATDYGRSLEDFAELALDDIDGHSTIIILGDARNNHNESRVDILQDLHQRAKQVIWLNPEPRSIWGSGDSDMIRYQFFCHFAAQCSNLKQLERIVDQLLRSAR